MSSPRHPRLVLFTALLGAVLAAACITPTIPLPPPEPDKATFNLDEAAGIATFSYDPDPEYAHALVYVLNQTRGEGVITTATADGAVLETAPFPGQDGDRVTIIFDVADRRAGLCLVLHHGRSSPGYRCE